MNVGRAIIELRKEKDLSQGELAEGVGISQSYLSQIENGHKEASTNLVKKMAEQLDQPTAAILMFALDEEDVATEKVEAFKVLSPLMKELMKGI